MRPRHPGRQNRSSLFLPGGPGATGPNTAPATQLTITVQPSSTAVSTVVFPQQPVVQARDATGTAVPQPGIAVMVSILTGTGVLQGSTLGVTDPSGSVAFTNLAISGAGSDQLLFVASGLTPVQSNAITVTALPVKLGMSVQPGSTATSGLLLSPQPKVQILDASNNPVAQAGTSITVAVGSGTGVLSGTLTQVSDSTGLATFTDLVLTGVSTDTLTFTASGLTSVTSNAINVTASSSLDPLLQPFQNGDYNGGHFRVYDTATGWPAPATDLLLVDGTIPSPAVASIVSPTDILLTALNGATVLGRSPSDHPKYILLTKSNGTGPFYASLGLSTDTFNPDAVVSTMDWYQNDTIDLNAIHIKAFDDTLTHYSVFVSTTTPETGSVYLASATALNAANAAVTRIGITITPSIVTTGGASIAESSMITDRNGATDFMHVTSGTAGSTEHVHVTDGVNTGDSATVGPIASNRDLTITSLTTGGTGTTTSAIITVPAGAMLLVHKIDLHHNPPTLGDSSGNPLGSPPFALVEDAHVHGNNGGDLSIYSSGVLAASFTGTILFDPVGGNHAYLIAKGVPNLACSAIRVRPANTAMMHDESGALQVATITYPVAFTNAHNLGLAVFANYAPSLTSPRTGWTESAEFQDSATGNPFGLEAQQKLGGDTAASASWPVSPILLWGAAVEYEALP